MNCGFQSEYVWLDVPCSVAAQVDVEGRVSLVHTHTLDAALTHPALREDAGNCRGSLRWLITTKTEYGDFVLKECSSLLFLYGHSDTLSCSMALP